MPNREMIELIAAEGYMYVHRAHRALGKIIQLTKGEEAEWEVVPEDEAWSLLESWTPKPPNSEDTSSRS